MKRLPKVRLVRVIGKPQNYAAHLINDNTLLGYCGRDGVITHPVGDVLPNTLTEVVQAEDPRLSRHGLKRSMETIQKIIEHGGSDTADVSRREPPKWVEISRKEVGLSIAHPQSMPGAPNRPLFTLLYEVVEKLSGTKDPEVRTRLVQGRPCRFRGEGFDAFVSLFAAYFEHARQHDLGAHEETHTDCYRKGEKPVRGKIEFQFKSGAPVSDSAASSTPRAATRSKRGKSNASA